MTAFPFLVAKLFALTVSLRITANGRNPLRLDECSSCFWPVLVLVCVCVCFYCIKFFPNYDESSSMQSATFLVTAVCTSAN